MSKFARLGVALVLSFVPSASHADSLDLDFRADLPIEEQWETIASSGPVGLERIFTTEGEVMVKKTGGGDVSLKPVRWAGSGKEIEVTATFRSLPLENAGSVGIWIGQNQGDQVGILGMVRILSPDEIDLRIYPPMSLRQVRTTQPIAGESRPSASTLRKQDFLIIRFAVTRSDQGGLLELSLISARTGEVLCELSTESPTEIPEQIEFIGIRFAGETFLWRDFSVNQPVH